MSCTRFDIVVVCAGYGERLAASLHYWSRMSYDEDLFRILVATRAGDGATAAAVARSKMRNVRLVEFGGREFNNKGLMIRFSLARTPEPLGDYVVLSDADMIFYPGFLAKLAQAVAEKGDAVFSSMREDISEVDVDRFLRRHAAERPDWAWKDVAVEVTSPSPFMGWFLAFPRRFAGRLDYMVDRPGYDVVDWMILKQLSNLGLARHLVGLDLAPLHIYHGPKGANWSGVDRPDQVLPGTVGGVGLPDLEAVEGRQADLGDVV